MLFVAFSSFGQEICDNGIDDDADGLIDLNDVTDCVCNTFSTTTQVTSLIPNPSFEDTVYCPNKPGQMDAATGWIQPTKSTTDYINTCGFNLPAVTDAGLVPFPDGNGVVGMVVSTHTKDYVGACLLSPLLAGTEYTLQLNLADVTMESGYFVDYGGPGPGATFTYPWPPYDTYGSYGAIDFTIYGSKSCDNLPIDTEGCPTSANSSWIILGSVSYTPKSSWSVENIVFTPTENITAIMIGPPCEIPSDFPQIESADMISPIAYFLVDNLILNQTSLFKPLGISKTGSYCTNDIVFTATVPIDSPPNSTLQWYKNGIAIVGSTGTSYSVPSGTTGLGNYQVRLTDGIVCGVSSKISVLEESAPVISLTSDASISQGDSISLMASGGTKYTWSPSDGLSCTTCPTPVASPNHTTEYCVEVSNNTSCVSSQCVEIKVNLTLTCGELFVPNSFSPNGDGINDLLKVEINPNCLSDYSFTIFDRWGEKVFESTKISESWDGKHNGKELDNAAFVYHLKMKLIDSTQVNKTGNISIVK